MKIFSYIQYFFYLGLNWNWSIAFYILSGEVRGEKKYGINTTGSDELKKTAASGVDISHATVYMPASYLLLEEVFARLPLLHRNHFVDIGCGKGRAVCVAAHQGFIKVTGIDFSPGLCRTARANLRRTQALYPSLNYFIVDGNAETLSIPEDADCIFLFNPFDEFIMQQVAKNIKDSHLKKPRLIHIIYLNPLYKEVLLQVGFKEIFYTCKMKYMEAVILKNNG